MLVNESVTSQLPLTFLKIYSGKFYFKREKTYHNLADFWIIKFSKENKSTSPSLYILNSLS